MTFKGSVFALANDILSSWIGVLLVIVHSNVCVSMESWCNIYMLQFILHILHVYVWNNCMVFFYAYIFSWQINYFFQYIFRYNLFYICITSVWVLMYPIFHLCVFIYVGVWIISCVLFFITSTVIRYVIDIYIYIYILYMYLMSCLFTYFMCVLFFM